MFKIYFCNFIISSKIINWLLTFILYLISFEIGSESCYWPPERFIQNSVPFDGRKIDSWCLALLIVESLTKNYLTSKSSKKTTGLKMYDALYKILQVSEF